MEEDSEFFGCIVCHCTAKISLVSVQNSFSQVFKFVSPSFKKMTVLLKVMHQSMEIFETLVGFKPVF